MAQWWGKEEGVKLSAEFASGKLTRKWKQIPVKTRYPHLTSPQYGSRRGADKQSFPFWVELRFKCSENIPTIFTNFPNTFCKNFHLTSEIKHAADNWHSSHHAHGSGFNHFGPAPLEHGNGRRSDGRYCLHQALPKTI